MKMEESIEIQVAKEKYRKVYLNPMTPLNFLKRSELVFADKTAVVYRDKSYTWAQFAERVYRLANGLKNWGLKKDERAVILSRNNNAMLEAFYGIGMAGGVSVPLNYRLSPEDLTYILNHSGGKVLIFEHVYADTIRDIQSKLKTVQLYLEIQSFDKPDGDSLGMPYEEFLTSNSSQTLAAPVTDERDMLSIVYTSGTTGTPKGCVHTHRGAYLNALGEALEARMHSGSSYLWTLPMFHCQGWCFVWAVTAVGGKHVCLDAVRAEQIYELMASENVTNMCGAPTAYNMVTDYMIKNDLKFDHSIRGFMAGASPSLKNIIDAEAVNIDIHQVYGLTEVYGPHTICEWRDDIWNDLPLAQKARIKARQGVPYMTYTPVRVVDDDMNDIPWDGETRGEIVMCGNNVMQWYFMEHDRTEKAFQGGWFHSGDAAVVHPNGYIQIVDRIKDIIISGGENISSVEVENVLAENPAVLDCAVIGKPDERWGEIVKAVVKVIPEATLTREEVIAWCKERLAGFKVPRLVEFTDVPRTATGKIQKDVLKKRELEMSQSAN